MNGLILINYFMLIAYIPFAIYNDLRYREVPEDFWKPLYVVCAPITAYLYLTRVYAPEALIISLVFVAIYFGLWVFQLYQGADFIYLAAITLFLVHTPKGDPIASIPFMLFLITSVIMVATFLVGSKIAIRKLNLKDEDKPRWLYDIEHLTSIPFMVQISMALIFTAVFA